MDKEYMKEALNLAALGREKVEPNPMVGAIIVKDGRIIGKGYHRVFGKAHAEVEAFNDASESVEGATMYVTLEPCAHYGKTPPCASLIVSKKIKKVVIASVDPNPLVEGKGIQILKDAGIEVESGVCDLENKQLNKVFFKYIQTRMPYVTMKTAMTLDGKLALSTGESKWISNATSRKAVHELRHINKGIMVGINTVLKDDPRLNTRRENQESNQPVRIILDTHLRILMASNIVKTAHQQKTIVITSERAEAAKVSGLQEAGIEVVTVALKDNQLDIVEALKACGARGISSILLEGGSTLNYSCMHAGVVDEVISFIAPKIVGGSAKFTPVGGVGVATLNDAFELTLNSIKEYDGDVSLSYFVRRRD